jgi:hypothetical protein
MVDEEPVTRRAHAPMKRQHSLRACGARPSRGPGPSERPCGENPEKTRRPVFSEGRGLRARVARPCASRGTSSSRTTWRTAGCLAGTSLGCTQAIFAGVRSPPLRGGQAWVRGLGGKPGNNADGGFLGGARSPRPCCEAVRMARDFIPAGGLTMSRWQKGVMSSLA